jgi:SAM-dependent methyltransferase
MRTAVGCPACGGLVESEAIEIPDHEYGLEQLARYAECQACGTIFQNPMPDVSELTKFYPPDYHSMTHGGLLNSVRNEMRIRRLTKLAPDDGPILDFGCGDGAFLAQAAQTMPGRALWGFEIAERPSKADLAGGAVKIVRGGLSDLLEVLPACSLITMNHVIEHLPDPKATVTALALRLANGGIFEGQTPASDSLERAVFGRRWSGYHAPRHTVVFSRAGLCTMLERCGLSAPRPKGAFNPAGIAVSLGSLSHRGRGRIQRNGFRWLSLLGMAGLLASIDLASRRPGIMNFVAVKNAG